MFEHNVYSPRAGLDNTLGSECSYKSKSFVTLVISRCCLPFNDFLKKNPNVNAK